MQKTDGKAAASDLNQVQTWNDWTQCFCELPPDRMLVLYFTIYKLARSRLFKSYCLSYAKMHNTLCSWNNFDWAWQGRYDSLAVSQSLGKRGFSNYDIQILRKRNSLKTLINKKRINETFRQYWVLVQNQHKAQQNSAILQMFISQKNACCAKIKISQLNV